MKRNDKKENYNIGLMTPTTPKKKELTEHTKKLIAMLIISQISIAFFIKIINLRLFDIISGTLAIIILITILYKIITEK